MSLDYVSQAFAIRRGRSPLVACWSLLVLSIAVWDGSTVWAAETAESRLRAHLESGEFGPARAIAAQFSTPAERDRWLGEIAAAQARAGARRASLATLSEIGDDRLRSGALDQIVNQPVGSRAGAGGGAYADFDTLMNLIESTIYPESWDTVGGPGAMETFPTGVYVDASGTLKRISADDAGGELADLRRRSLGVGANREVRKPSALRKVSLSRLEKQVQLRWALGQGPDEAMKNLAGMYRVEYVLAYPESGDVVVAGPAGDWQPAADGRLANVDTAHPVLQLDDLVVMLRNSFLGEGRFTCAITPTREGLARTQAFLKESAMKPLKRGQRAAWMRQLHDCLGKQTIDVSGIDPRTRAARVIVEADYHMKLIGMGLEERVLGVDSYLDMVAASGEEPPSMEVLRWWFTLNYETIQSTPQRDTFRLRGQGVRVLSENELLTERGERVHTGKSESLNSEFARSFTRHFNSLAAKYPVYAELRNVFDLALAAALLKAEDLPNQTGWHMMHFLDDQKYCVALAAAPKEVDSVINHRVVDRARIIAGVSGGVLADPRSLTKPASFQIDNYGLLGAERTGAAPQQLSQDAWWWD